MLVSQVTMKYPPEIHLQERKLVTTAKSEVTSRNSFKDVLVSTRAPTYKGGGMSREWNRMENVECLAEASPPRLGAAVHTIYLCILSVYGQSRERRYGYREQLVIEESVYQAI